jgi:pyrroline-5-carboxylate reductase
MSDKLAVIGGGNMGAALLGGLVAGGHPLDGLAVVEVVAARREELGRTFPGVAVSADVPACTAAIIAVKPEHVLAACRSAVAAGARRVLSIAAGVTVSALESACGPDVAVVRAMPNTPSLVGAGASGICAGATAGSDDLDWADSVLSTVGLVVRVSESQLDAVTGVSGSGPAYLFLVAEALMDAGVAHGLPRATSEALVRQLLVGSAALLAAGGSPADLRTQVTSPGGTTAAGVRVLEDRAVRAAMQAAVAAAVERSREMSRG